MFHSMLRSLIVGLSITLCKGKNMSAVVIPKLRGIFFNALKETILVPHNQHF